ncbi:ribbon-helix-helix protein, CopG family [Roseovarius sp. S1116L3]|uniref:ribbon-helix-helix protein, CopG family n=1 Tax=Roseovarius roseus TaxID=3342636 RepID=UPI00372652EB
MGALNIRDIGEDRKAALDAEAKAQGVSVSELVRRYLDEGVERARSSRAHKEWLKESRNGLAFEAAALGRDGPSLARYRRVPGAGEGR